MDIIKLPKEDREGVSVLSDQGSESFDHISDTRDSICRKDYVSLSYNNKYNFYRAWWGDKMEKNVSATGWDVILYALKKLIWSKFFA